MTQIANAAAKVEHPTVEALRMFVRNPAANAGMVILLLVILVSIVGPLIYGADPFEIRAAPLTAPFTEEAWLGTSGWVARGPAQAANRQMRLLMNATRKRLMCSLVMVKLRA